MFLAVPRPTCSRRFWKSRGATITWIPKPRTLSGTEHRPAYGSDGDYWSKPNAESIFDAVYDLMHEVDPARFPAMQ